MDLDSLYDYSTIRGFNYQPSYGSNGMELWGRFDPAVISHELSIGKSYFPKMNSIRFWHSWDAYIREPKAYMQKFEEVLHITSELGLSMMPVLFNRWHDKDLDYGGIYIDHFLPGVSWVQKDNMFQPYLEDIVGTHASDPRIIAWDLCNEPFSYNLPVTDFPEIAKAEAAWLELLYTSCKKMGAKAPVTVGSHIYSPLAAVEAFSDLLSIHPYYIPDGNKPDDKRDFVNLLDEYVLLSEKTGKPLVATETCWGSTDDAERVENIRYTLSELVRRKIGYYSYLLYHSLIADAHREEFGPMGRAGNLSFIEADGELRAGHDIWNEFT